MSSSLPCLLDGFGGCLHSSIIEWFSLVFARQELELAMFAAKNNITLNRSSSFIKLACWGADFLWSWCLKQKEWYAVKASSFVGATILSAKMGTVINIRVCYTLSATSKQSHVFYSFLPQLYIFCYVLLNTRVKESDYFNYSFSCHIRCHNALLMLLESLACTNINESTVCWLLHFGCMKDHKNRSVAVLW